MLFLLPNCTTIKESRDTKNETAHTPANYFLAAERFERKKQHHQMNQTNLHKALNAYFTNAISQNKIIGAGVSVVKGDSIVFEGGFGMRNYKKKDQIDAHTVFRLGSLSKGFAGVLSAVHVNNGVMKWDDKVIDALPNFKLGNTGNTKQITLAHILSQSSGTPYHSYTDLVEAGFKLSDIADRFDRVKPNAAPGIEYSYQNAIFAFSGKMIEEATGKTLSESLESSLFEPLSMHSASSTYDGLIDTGNFAVPHSKGKYGWRRISINRKYYNAIAAGGINASANDMAQWVKFILHNQESLSAVFEPKIKILESRKYYQRWPEHISSHYGLGWRIHKYVDTQTQTEKTIWHHGGTVSRYRNEIAIFPEDNLGFTILFNSLSPLASTIVPDLHKLIKENWQEYSELEGENAILASNPEKSTGALGI